MQTNTLIGGILGVALLAAPVVALAAPSWFTGASYYTGPSYYVGSGGYSTGPWMAGSGYGYGGYPSTLLGSGGNYAALGIYNYGGYGGYNWRQYIPTHAQQYVFGYGLYGQGGWY